MTAMGSRSADSRRGWLLLPGAALFAVLAMLAWPARSPAPDPGGQTMATQDSPLAEPAGSDAAAPTQALPPTTTDRREWIAPRIQVVDCEQRPVASWLTFLVDDGIHCVDCPPTGAFIPRQWSHVLVRQPGWAPLCRTTSDVEARGDGVYVLHLPAPSLTAHVLAPDDVVNVVLEADVDLEEYVAGWPPRLRRLTFGDPPARCIVHLVLQVHDQQVSVGGLPTGSLRLTTPNRLRFRNADGGRSEDWQAIVPLRSGLIELVHPPCLRVTPKLAAGCELDCELLLDARLFDGDAVGWDHLERDAAFDLVTGIPLDTCVRRTHLRLFSKASHHLLADNWIDLSGDDQDAELPVGTDAFEVAIVDPTGTLVADARVLEGDELLGATGPDGRVWILAAQSGPILAMARGFDGAQVPLADLRRTRRIQLPAASSLVVDARHAAQALGGAANVVFDGGFAAIAHSQAGFELLKTWNGDIPASTIRDCSGGPTLLEQASFGVNPGNLLHLPGLFATGVPVCLRLCDRAGGDTGVVVTVQLAPGETRHIELRVPEVAHYQGTIVSARTGEPVGIEWLEYVGFDYLLYCGTKFAQFPPPEALDLCLAKGAALTITGYGCIPRTFAQPEPNGRYELTPARRLRLHIVDAGQQPLACSATLVDASGQEYAPAADLSFAAVPDTPLTARLRRGDELREFGVPPDCTAHTLVWQ